MESIDDLLAQVKAEYQEDENPEQSKKQPLFKEEELNTPPPTYQPQPQEQSWMSPIEESLLAQVKVEFEEKEQAEKTALQQQEQQAQLRKEQQIQEEQQLAKLRQQRKREALTQQAQEWLKNLNLHSEEGLWFEEFSYSYSSKLEAAIDYLQALRETKTLN
ncbi:MAG: hypothetical protein KME06_19245 [Kastovskya adunca ATA6-11-RM4]|jgi:hypothetical protein|nr:hypothetical protein [Kastovskya adunca ATA6-11-RM4]